MAEMMLSWLVRLILLISGVIAGFFVARDAVNFPVIQGVVALGGLAIFVVALWPRRWSELLDNPLRAPRD
jgi:hypothetical protein